MGGATTDLARPLTSAQHPHMLTCFPPALLQEGEGATCEEEEKESRKEKKEGTGEDGVEVREGDGK